MWYCIGNFKQANLFYIFVSFTESNTEYKLWVKAFTSENDGEPSEHHFVKTDVGIPSAPKIANLTCYSDTVLFIQWLRPVYFSNSIDYYYIEYRNEKDWDFEVQEVASTNNRNDYMVWNLIWFL